MTFQELCRDLRVTRRERKELACYLAYIRSRALIRALTSGDDRGMD